MMPQHTREILEDLEAVRENLLALSDDIWLSIDHNDNETLDEGVRFKRTYNEKMAAFDRLATELSELVQQFTSVSLGEGEQSGEGDQQRNERLVRELSRDEPHGLDEDFTWKRPHGYILSGHATTGLTTWRRLYELVCGQLLRQSPEGFAALVDDPNFISSRDHHAFSRDPADLRSATEIGSGLHAEINLSANSIRDHLRRLLAAFDIPTDRLQLFLREDRDAERSTDE